MAESLETSTAASATLQETPPLIADPVEAAHSAGLRYYTDARLGIRRKRAGKRFSYIGVDGVPIRDPKELKRLMALAIPPAWTDVWICPSPDGHIQATGRDAKGRKQYRYHQRWREVRDETKYGRMIAFGETLPLIRERTERDVALHCLSREKVLATVVELLDATAIRVGNEEYARVNHSYGLTTLRTRHVDIHGSTLRFHFPSKGGKEQVVGLRHRRLAQAVKRCQDLPGYELFQYLDDNGERHSIDSADVNDYLRQITGQNFTAKDFRTWHGTLAAACALSDIGEGESETDAKKNIAEAIAVAADHLGNTPAICRKSYVHPGVIEAYLDGTLISTWRRAVDESRASPTAGLYPEEVALLAILQQEVDEEAAPGRVAS